MAKHIPVRLMDRPEDYQRMGTKPGLIEPWEDGRRDDDRAGAYEWWYFDMIMDDGSKVVLHYNTKSPKNIAKDGTQPSVVLKITDPDGTPHTDSLDLTAGQARFGEGKCDVAFGPHTLEGDLKTYRMHIEPINGLGADLTLVNDGKPWRPDAGGFSFGDNDEGYFTWLCAVPSGRVSGSIIVNGKRRTVTGSGYHDHQWGNMDHKSTWSCWLWSRQRFEDHTIVVFHIVAAKKYGYAHLPMMFIEDAQGNLVMDSLDNPKVTVLEEYHEELSGKDYPKRIRFDFDNGGKQVSYTLKVKQQLEARGMNAILPTAAKVLTPVFKKIDFLPSTARFFAQGDMTLASGDGTPTIRRSGDLIYEFVYMGTDYQARMCDKA